MLTKPEVLERNDERGVWCVEQIDEPEGECYVTVFYGPNSEQRAKAYAEYLDRSAEADE